MKITNKIQTNQLKKAKNKPNSLSKVYPIIFKDTWREKSTTEF